jgi:preprotein translocase subunit YajC
VNDLAIVLTRGEIYQALVFVVVIVTFYFIVRAKQRDGKE